MNKVDVLRVFKGYYTEPLVDLLLLWEKEFRCDIVFKKERKTIHGDCRFSFNERMNYITVNVSSNPFGTLITLLHEMSHAKQHILFQRSQSHGLEWKNIFRELVYSVKALGVFPYDLEVAIERHFRNPKYTHSADYILSGVIRNYDGLICKDDVYCLNKSDAIPFAKGRVYEELLEDGYVSVESSNIHSVKYSDFQLCLYVRFKSGAYYCYRGVTRDVYDMFMDAPSKGRCLNKNIVNCYPYEFLGSL